MLVELAPAPATQLTLKSVTCTQEALLNLGDYQNLKVSLSATFDVPDGMTLEHASQAASVQVRDALLEQIANVKGWYVKNASLRIAEIAAPAVVSEPAPAMPEERNPYVSQDAAEEAIEQDARDERLPFDGSDEDEDDD